MSTIELNKKEIEIFKQQKEAFRKHFGRDPEPGEPIFFDPDFEYPTQMSPEKFMELIVEACTKAGIDSYAALKHFQFTDEEIEKYHNKPGEV